MFKIALNSEHIVHLKIHVNWNPTFTKYKTGRKDHYLLNFRFVILPLQIEMGHWKNIKYEYRICKICDEGVESENHFVFSAHYILKKEDFSTDV